MLSISLRILLVTGAVLVFAAIALRVKKSRMQIQDALFWLVLGALLVVMSLFPGIAMFFARLFQVQSPTNFVFLAAIAILLVKQFDDASQISQLKHRVNQLTQEVGLSETEDARRDAALAEARADALAGELIAEYAPELEHREPIPAAPPVACEEPERAE